MTLQLHNSLTHTVEPLRPLDSANVRIYSCGPTVYDNVHIGNLSAFVAADTLRRVVAANNFTVTHVMNFTDVDDKIIKRAQAEYADTDPMEALRTITTKYGDVFLTDMQAIGNDTDAMTFIKATDPATIAGMQQRIAELHEQGFAYIADDGVYFSIEAYRNSGKTYGQLVELSGQAHSSERIANDEYDKESLHDFALWKTKKPGEPSWEFTLDGHDLAGRPGWHIECSVMSRLTLDQPFDIHTGGVDLTFPHHENEIAQSTAGQDDPVYASTFVHNEHILVDGKKMSKSLGNFFTLADLKEKGVDPLAFRLLVLQSHYRKATNFSFDTIQAATNRLNRWRNIAALRHQTHDALSGDREEKISLLAASQALVEVLSNDLDTPHALRHIDEAFATIESKPLARIDRDSLVMFLQTIDDTLGLQLLTSTPDITDEVKKLILERQRARETKDWGQSDTLRDTLLSQGIAVRDTPFGPVWEYST